MPKPVAALLHGFAGAPAAWDRVRAAWPTAITFVVPALPGHGRDAPPPVGGFTNAVDAVADRLPSTPLHLVGYSLGARISLGLALAYPERVVRLTLIGVNPGIDDDQRAARRANDERWAQHLEAEGVASFAAAWQAQPLFATQDALCPARRQEQDRWRQTLDPHRLAAAMRQMSLADMPDYRPRFAELRGPVQLTVGERDDKFRAIAARMQRDHVRLDVIPGVGHNVPLEAPDALADRVAAFGAGGRGLLLR